MSRVNYLIDHDDWLSSSPLNIFVTGPSKVGKSRLIFELSQYRPLSRFLDHVNKRLPVADRDAYGQAIMFWELPTYKIDSGDVFEMVTEWRNDICPDIIINVTTDVYSLAQRAAAVELFSTPYLLCQEPSKVMDYFDTLATQAYDRAHTILDMYEGSTRDLREVFLSGPNRVKFAPNDMILINMYYSSPHAPIDEMGVWFPLPDVEKEEHDTYTMINGEWALSIPDALDYAVSKRCPATSWVESYSRGLLAEDAIDAGLDSFDLGRLSDNYETLLTSLRLTKGDGLIFTL
jgi:hypothetical protein